MEHQSQLHQIFLTPPHPISTLLMLCAELPHLPVLEDFSKCVATPVTEVTRSKYLIEATMPPMCVW
jgi:hypothetical protein